MTMSDKKMLDSVSTPHGKWWVPFTWCFNILKTARQEGRIKDDFLLKTLWEEIINYRTNLGTLYSYDWISIPLVYTQVTTLAVYTFFLGCVLGRQFLDPAQGYPGHDVDLYVPVFTLLQFFFYMGWLKVAEQMINPFGEDDDDFDMNWIIDRNLQVSLLTVDSMYMQFPTLERDMYWDEYPPDYLPYTKSALSSLTKPFMGSTADISVSDEGMQIVQPMETISENCTLELGQQNPVWEAPSAPTPCRTPRPGHKLLSNLYSQISQSHLNLGSAHNIEKPSISQSLPQEPAKPKLSYLESWLHDASKRACSKVDLPDISPDTDIPQFRGRSESSHSLGVKKKFIEVQSPLCSSVPNQPISQSVVAMPESTPAYAQSPCQTPLAETVSLVPAQDTIVSIPADNADGSVTPVVNTLTIRGSHGSLHEYASSDSTNSTVNSMAPLLKDYQDTVIDV